MKLLDRFRSWLAPREVRSGYANPDDWLYEALTGGRSKSGVSVTETTTLGYSAIYCGIRLIAETIGSLPWHLYDRTADGKERNTSDPLAMLLHDSPNEEMTASVYLQSQVLAFYLYGNMVSEIVRNRAGMVKAVYPIHPSRVEVKRNDSGNLVYSILQPDGVTRRNMKPDRIWHVPLLAADGIVGKGLLQRARESMGYSLALETYGAAHFGNGAQPGGVLEHPGRLDANARKNIRSEWEAIHQGPDRAGRIAVLQEGMKYSGVAISPEDSQMIENRKFQVGEVARWLNIPPHLLKDLERATFSNIEQQAIEFVTYTIRPILVMIEQETNRKFIPEDERARRFNEFLIDGLLRGDIQSRYNAYAIARNNGWMNADEIRSRENMNPMPDGLGQRYLVQGAMVPIELAGVAQQQKSEQTGDKKADSARQLAMIEAHTALLRGVMQKSVTKEANEARRASKKPSSFLKWMETFYLEHSDVLKTALEPNIRAFELATGYAIDIPALIARHITQSREQLLNASGTATANELPERIEAVVTAWEAGRAASFVTNEITHTIAGGS